MSGPPARLVVLFGLAFVLSQANLGYMLGPLSPNIVAVQLTFHSQAFWEAMTAWGPEGMARLKATMQPWDMLHPFIYGVFGYLLVMRTHLFTLKPPWHQIFAWMLPVAGACDLLENVCELYLLSLPFGSQSVAIPVSATFSLVKWGLAAGFALSVLIAGIHRLIKPR